MKVKDVASKEVFSATPSTSAKEIASMMKRHNIGFVPILEDEQLVGVVTDRDIVLSCVASGMITCQASQFMTSSPIACSPDTSLDEAARIMAREQIHRLPILENGKLIGVLSLGDLATALKNDALVAETLKKVSSPTKVAVPA